MWFLKKEGINYEMHSIISNNSWALIDLDPNSNHVWYKLVVFFLNNITMYNNGGSVLNLKHDQLPDKEAAI
jgi:hypothetical protein